jgi:nucleoside-diphosphate-sugar epimerase
MKILVTGASGYVGNRLTHALANRNYKVHAFVRSAIAERILQHPNITVFKGDVLDKASLSAAIKGCEQVYHTASLVKMWDKDPALFHEQNVSGTNNVLEAALREGVQKLVYTSTCGVWGSSSGHPLTEKDVPGSSFETDYDLTKQLAEKSVAGYHSKGLSAVIVNLSRVFGPGQLRYSSGINRFICQLLKNKICPLPWHAEAKGNYAFMEDVVEGHILAMEKSPGGERYILGGENVSYKRFADTVARLAGSKNIFLRIPTVLLKTWSWTELARGKLTDHQPVMTPNIVRRLQSDKAFDCGKAIEKLGYRITPFEKAMRITIDYLKHQC